MILFVLSVALMNFGLGYAIAVALADAPLIPPGFLARVKASLTAEGEDEDEGIDTPASLADLPAEWLTQLAAAGFSPATMLEGLLLKLWCEVAPHREELLTAEVRARQALGRLDLPAVGQLLTDVRSHQNEWQAQLLAMQQVLQKRLKVLGSEMPCGDRLDWLLDRQLKNLDENSQAFTELALNFEAEVGARKLLACLGHAIDAAHQLRDCVQHLLAERLRGESSPGDLGQPLYLDALTGQISRIGLEGLFELWWQDDPQRLRLASCALLKIDRFARLNERLGYRAGDRVLTAIASLFANAIRTDRGFDRLARFEGGTFLLFFGDTGPGNGAIVVERIRQAFEALTLDYEGNELDVSISAGVAPLLREDDVDSLLARAQTALANAERNGRNRTSVDNGEGPAPMFEPQRYAVRAQRLPIATA